MMCYQILKQAPVEQLDGLVQERCNFSVLAMELHLSCTNPLNCKLETNGYDNVLSLSKYASMIGSKFLL